MLKTKTLQKGFTIVELLIVIVVIGILAALVLNTFSGVQKRARDSERQTDINSLSTQLEVYYNDNGGYPALSQIDTGTEATTLFKGMDAEAISAPGQTGESLLDVYSATPNKDQYSYQAYNSGGVVVCTVTTGCGKYVLNYFSENGNAVKSKNSLNQ